MDNQFKLKEYLNILEQQVSSDLLTVGGSNYSINVDIGIATINIPGSFAMDIRKRVIDFLKFDLANIDKPIHNAQAFSKVKTYQSNEVYNSGMVDWFRGEIIFTHQPIPTGKRLSLDSDGSVEYILEKRTQARGSFESSLLLKSNTVTSDGTAQTLQIDGNISKFIQGHNVFGSLNLNSLLLQAFNKIIKIFGHLFSYTDSFNTLKNIAKAEQQIEEGNYLVKSLDINFTYDLGTDKAVEQWLYSAEYNARCQSGRAVRNSGDNTVYLQKHSRRWAIKFYNKYLEATSGDKKHSLNQHFIDLGLAKFVEGKLRVELRLLSLELKDLGLQHGHQLTPEVLTGLFQTYLEKIEMKPNKLLVDDEIDKLSGKVQNTYRKWRAGKNIKKDLPQNTYYRHRRDLLNVGVDISIPPLEVDKPNNVVPMLRPLEAKPVENPQWAYEQGLIAS